MRADQFHSPRFTSSSTLRGTGSPDRSRIQSNRGPMTSAAGGGLFIHKIGKLNNWVADR